MAVRSVKTRVGVLGPTKSEAFNFVSNSFLKWQYPHSIKVRHKVNQVKVLSVAILLYLELCCYLFFARTIAEIGVSRRQINGGPF